MAASGAVVFGLVVRLRAGALGASPTAESSVGALALAVLALLAADLVEVAFAAAFGGATSALGGPAGADALRDRGACVTGSGAWKMTAVEGSSGVVLSSLTRVLLNGAPHTKRRYLVNRGSEFPTAQVLSFATAADLSAHPRVASPLCGGFQSGLAANLRCVRRAVGIRCG